MPISTAGEAVRAVIRPGRARGVVAAPPSKSMAHRLLICAGLARGESLVRRVTQSDDLLATVDCLRALGASLAWESEDVRVRGCDPRSARPARLPCRESGSTLRFMIPLCLLSGQPMRLEGSETLLNRPLSIFEDICRARGFRFERTAGTLLAAGRLAPGEYVVPGNVSSQFVSGLLFALPLLNGPSVIRLIPPVESRPYLDLTLQALAGAGVAARWQDQLTLEIPGRAAYAPREAVVEGDYTSAAFFAALNCLGGQVTISGLRPDSLQGDRVYVDCFERLMKGTPTLDVSDCPDLAPALFAVAAACHGGRFTGTRRLRFKECDRGEAMARELAKFGVSMTVSENEAVVCPGRLRAPSQPLSSHNDHRVAMALSALCTVTGGEIDGAQAVRKSLPAYWDMLRGLGVAVECRAMNAPHK